MLLVNCQVTPLGPQRIDRYRGTFFLIGSKTAPGLSCFANWHLVFKSEEEGGPGIKNLNNMNSAVLAKGVLEKIR